MKNTKIKKDEICTYLIQNHIGQENAAPCKMLEAVFSLNNRTVRKYIHALRCKGIPICSDKNGYYYPDSADEIAATIAQFKSRMTKLSNVKSAISNTLDNSYSGNHILIEIRVSVR